MVWWLVVCFEDRSERDKNKRNFFLMCLGTVCTDMMMMGCVCVCDGPYTVYTLLLLLLLFRRFFARPVYYSEGVNMYEHNELSHIRYVHVPRYNRCPSPIRSR